MNESGLHWFFLSRLALKGVTRPTQRERADAITRLQPQLSTYEGKVSLSGLSRNEISVCLRVFAPSISHAGDAGMLAMKQALKESGLGKWYEPTGDPRFPKVIAR